jgi:hypothetical protein
MPALEPSAVKSEPVDAPTSDGGSLAPPPPPLPPLLLAAAPGSPPEESTEGDHGRNFGGSDADAAAADGDDHVAKQEDDGQGEAGAVGGNDEDAEELEEVGEHHAVAGEEEEGEELEEGQEPEELEEGQDDEDDASSVTRVGAGSPDNALTSFIESGSEARLQVCHYRHHNNSNSIFDEMLILASLILYSFVLTLWCFFFLFRKQAALDMEVVVDEASID